MGSFGFSRIFFASPPIRLFLRRGPTGTENFESPHQKFREKTLVGGAQFLPPLGGHPPGKNLGCDLHCHKPTMGIRKENRMFLVILHWAIFLSNMKWKYFTAMILEKRRRGKKNMNKWKHIEGYHLWPRSLHIYSCDLVILPFTSTFWTCV